MSWSNDKIKVGQRKCHRICGIMETHGGNGTGYGNDGICVTERYDKNESVK